MERRTTNLIGLGLMGLAVILAFAQWVAVWSGNVLSSAIEGVQAWALIPLAVAFVAVLAYRGSATFSDFIRRFFSIRANLVLPVTMLAYLSTTWLSGFHEKYDATAWQNGTALKGFWLGTIAQGHAPNPFGAVHYSFWVNILQWLVDHSVYSWFGWVVIISEATIALTFITAIVATVYRPAIVAASAGALLALLYHFFFLMSGSAGVNSLMPFLTGIAAVCLIANAVARSEKPAVEGVHPLETVLRETVPIAVASNGQMTEKTPALTK